ncbi:MAG TPA: hypothetical protein VK557_19730 [Pyrinomonadaceae bacterium]|nr:hypothetical protein [Pyrinomonadaceae bacterium]
MKFINSTFHAVVMAGVPVFGSLHITSGGVVVLDAGPTSLLDLTGMELPAFKASEP